MHRLLLSLHKLLHTHQSNGFWGHVGDVGSLELLPYLISANVYYEIVSNSICKNIKCCLRGIHIWLDECVTQLLL